MLSLLNHLTRDEIKRRQVMGFYREVLKIDCSAEAERIVAFIKDQVQSMHRKGIIIGLSGGVDSALSVALSVKALGKDKVMALLLPDKESSPQSAEFASKQAELLGIESLTIDITPVLDAFGTYGKRDAVAKAIYPEFGDGHKLKITLPSDILDKDGYNFFTLTVIDPRGTARTTRLNNDQAQGIIAATCTKHRTRMMVQYYYSEKSNYLVCGTTNKSEALQGLFVKYGDGGVDIEPIAHLYKNQVFQLAEHLGVIPEILQRAPCPDTYSAPVTDEEWFFRMPFKMLDLLLYAWENKVEISEICRVMELTEDQVKRAFRDFSSKYHTTEHLRHLPPSLI
jgi:NAD+ synthase